MPQRGEPVVCGRRICADCKHWRHITDFGYRKAGEDVWILRICQACKRAQQRAYYHADPETHKQRVWAWQRRNPEKILAYRRTERASQKAAERNARYRANPEVAATRREYNRQYKERQRRAAGVPVRRLKSRHHRDYLAAIRAQADHLRDLAPKEKEPRLELAPFAEWITARLPAYEGSVEQLSDICEVHERQLRTLQSGKYMARGKLYAVKSVGLDFVDRCLLNEGSSDLWELYPDLYESLPESDFDTSEDKTPLAAA